MLDSLLNSAPIGIYVVDSDFRLFLVNSVARDIFGTATRWIGRPIDELIHTLWPNPYADSFLERLRRTLDTGEPDAHPEHTERRLDRPRTEHYEWQLARIEFAPGHHGVACYFRDISVQVKNYRELERQREALRAGNERLELAQSATGVGFFDWDIVHDTSHVSPEWMRIYGLDPKAAAPTHATWRECVHPDDRDAATAAALAAVQRGAPFEQEFRVLWPDGSSHWVESRGRTLFDAQGTPQRFIGTAIDVTARKATEQALVDSEQRFQVALRHTPLTMYATDRELRCTWIHNPALGVDAVALLGKRDEEVLPFAEVAPFVEIKRRVLGSGVGERRQVATRVGGVDYAFHVSIEPQRDAQGNIVGLIGAAMDVSEFVRAKEQAEAASKAKDEFLAVLSHELRTPLAPVLASAELLERDDLEPAQRRELAQVIRRNAELEARLIDDLLDVTRIANDKLELRLAAVDLHECIESVLSICRADAAAKDIAMAANFHAHDQPGQGRPCAAAAGDLEPGEERHQIHARGGLGDRDDAQSGGGLHRPRGGRLRHRHRRCPDAAPVQRLRAGWPRRHAEIRRLGAGPCHQQGAGSIASRADQRRQRRHRPGRHIHGGARHRRPAGSGRSGAGPGGPW